VQENSGRLEVEVAEAEAKEDEDKEDEVLEDEDLLEAAADTG
jgi:hypothetical protein